MTTMHSIPKAERPRERLLKLGVEALSLTELLAIILSTGTKGKSSLALAQELVIRFRDLRGLLDASVEELMQVKGMGEAKAIKLRAVFGIVLKNMTASLPDRPLVRTAEDAFELARKEIGYEKKEVLLVILKDVRGALIQLEKISVGTLSEVLVHPREVFNPAVRHNANSFILVHNHPSGDVTPSGADLELTRLLLCSSKVMGIALDDHLVISSTRFLSLRKKGYI
jgi:DNA repair protein RadC